MRNSILIITVTCLFFAACKKEDKENSDVTFVNQLDEQITLDIYASMDDYNNNNNVVLRKVLTPKENTIIPASTLQKGTTYYMDWYSDNYNYNNWFNNKFESNVNSQVAFTPGTGNYAFYINTQSASGARNAFLPNESASSKWAAVNVYAYSKSTGYVSYTQLLSAQERFREIIVKKGFIAEYNHQDQAGKIITDNIEFAVRYTNTPYIELMDGNGQSAGYMTGGQLPSADGSAHESTATDSVMALFPDSEYVFLMVRNK